MTTKAELDKAIADSLKAERDAQQAASKPIISIERRPKRVAMLTTIAERVEDANTLAALYKMATSTR